MSNALAKSAQPAAAYDPKISATQFPNRSCLSALLSSYAYVFDSIDKNLPVDVAMPTFSRVNVLAMLIQLLIIKKL